MPKLNTSIIDSVSIQSLASCKIYSTLDFVHADVDKIVSNSKLDAEEAFDVKSKLITDYSCTPITAFDVFSKFNSSKVIATDIVGLDELLDGGLIKGAILEFCGLAGSGKTQVCLTLALKAALKGVKVEYIDSKLDFSASRCNSLLPNDICDREMDNILENINVSTPKNIYELISKVNGLDNCFKNAENVDRIIIIDSLTVPFLSLVGISSGLSLLNYTASKLKELAYCWNCAIIVTNLAAKHFETEDEEHPRRLSIEEVKPMLGKYWMHVPNSRILISRDGPFSTRRTLCILKSDYLPLKKTVELNISEKGVT